MIIFFPVRLHTTGGISAFARKFKEGAENAGNTVVFSWHKEYDILLVPAYCPLLYLLDAKLRGKTTVHRLDGVYYPSTVAGAAWWLYNLPLYIIHHFFANKTIYQSDFSKRSVEHWLGKASSRPETIIYNGVDIEIFTPTEKKPVAAFITASRFRRADQILPLIELLREYRKKYDQNATLTVIGDFYGTVTDIPRTYKNEPGLALLGAISNHNLPDYLNKASVFVHSHQNPACPNNVLEALACGLPIAGVADGAMPEIITSGYNGELLPVNGPNWNTIRSIEALGFADQVHNILNNYNHYTQNARQSALERFSLTGMTERYISFLAKRD